LHSPADHDTVTDVQTSPRLLLVGFHTPINQAAACRALDRLDDEGRPAPFLGLVSRDNFLGERVDAWLPDQRGFRDLGFGASRSWPLPPRRLWERLQPAEAVAMHMMDRTWRSARAGKKHESRKRRWLEWVTYAYGFLTAHGVERVLHCNVPHFPFQYALFETARAMGLETRFLMQLQVKDTYLVAPSIDELHEPVGRALEGGAGDHELEPRMGEELERRTTRHKPFYMSGKGIPAWTRFYTAQRRFFRGRLRSLPAAAAYRSARLKSGDPPKDGEPYVYLPLHLQPEATTLPLGGVYGDQSLVVETLARALPEGWLLVVKENPKQRFDKRSPGFYRRLASLPSVRLVGRDVSSFDLLESCRAVATITGSAGWEALCSNKPALVFGKAFYRHATGAAAIASLADARAALGAIADGSFPTPTKDDCGHFLAALQTVTHEGVCDAAYLRDSGRSEEESIETCTEAVLQGIEGAREPEVALHG